MKIDVDVKSNLNSVLFDILNNPDYFVEPETYYILIGVDYNETPFVLKDSDGYILKYNTLEKAKSIQTILNMGHLAKYYIDEIKF